MADTRLHEQIIQQILQIPAAPGMIIPLLRYELHVRLNTRVQSGGNRYAGSNHI